MEKANQNVCTVTCLVCLCVHQISLRYFLHTSQSSCQRLKVNSTINKGIQGAILIPASVWEFRIDFCAVSHRRVSLSLGRNQDHMKNCVLMHHYSVTQFADRNTYYHMIESGRIYSIRISRSLVVCIVKL